MDSWAEVVSSIDEISDALRSVLCDVEPVSAEERAPAANVVELHSAAPNVERDAA